MAFPVDPDEFLHLSEFAEYGTIGSTPSIKGIFKHDYAEVNEVEGYYPTFRVPTRDVPDGTAHETAVVVRSTNYTIVGIQPDAINVWTLLILEEADA